jgi:hypothetical protein
MDADQILHKSMKIAGDFCVYTNHNLIVERLDNNADNNGSKEGEQVTNSK